MGRIRHRAWIGGIDGPCIDCIRSRIVGQAKRVRGKEGAELLCHDHSLPPVQGALGTWEALKGSLKMMFSNFGQTFISDGMDASRAVTSLMVTMVSIL